jgi:hypothetical protein
LALSARSSCRHSSRSSRLPAEFMTGDHTPHTTRAYKIPTPATSQSTENSHHACHPATYIISHNRLGSYPPPTCAAPCCLSANVGPACCTHSRKSLH